MPLTYQFKNLPITDILIVRDERQRQTIDTKGLIESVKARGIMNPLIVERDPDASGKHRLVAGERRLTCAIELGHATVPVRFAKDLSASESQILELEENIKRQDLEWKDLVRSIAAIHQLYLGADPDWTMGETAYSIGLSIGTISLYLKVWGELQNEKVQACSTVREAYNLITRRDARKAGEALQEILEAEPLPAGHLAGGGEDGPCGAGSDVVGDGVGGEARANAHDRADFPVVDGASPPPGLSSPPPASRRPTPPRNPASTLLHESFLQWAPRYTGPKFNLLHCDFPYGIDLFAGRQGNQGQESRNASYDDSSEVYYNLLRCLCTNLDRLMSVSAHIMFWYSERNGNATREMFRELAPSLVWQSFPLIWLKSDNVGIVADARRTPRHIYETCLLGSRGSRQIVKVVADAYSAPTDKRFHISTKPEPMLRHFMSMLVDENSSVLDPTCGSASSIRAAESLGANHTLGLEIDEQTVGMARTALRNARNLKGGTGVF